MKKSLILIAFAFSVQAHADEPKLSFSTGIDYSTGKYGQAEKTDITYVPFNAKLETGRWTFKATVPYIEISGPANVAPDSRVVLAGVRPVRSRESGLGDVVLGGSYNVVTNTQRQYYVDLGGKVKLPTADEKRGLGTGKTDYAVYTDVYKTQGNLTWLGTVGYKVFGDPAGVNLNNVFYGSAGMSYKLSRQDSVGLVVDLREKTTPTTQGLREYSLFYAHKFNDTYKLQTYLVTGDTTSSVDLGAGAVLAVSW